uniref:RING finger protein nhl-1 n=2 Tax=Cacopsylla melanoneura TaxID=428564 RepID=A0A8D9BW06_9HEMI
MEQFEQLLTCAICLDRYRNPKLLPCQHSFCMEPCMDGLVDYVRRQVKCPECRAEHRIPYQGVQGFPTNVTLQRFLELHIEITGELPDPTSGQTMKRCSVCSEKSYVTMCGHCDKEVCADCKGAHMDILRREIARINSQVRRALHRLQDMLALVERNMLALQTNCNSVSEEVEEIHSRLTKALKDRTEFLQGELDRYLTTEVKNLSQLKENLELEIANISSNCDLADEHMQNENVEWDDLELMDAKEIFLRTVEFIRNFETETTDYTRRVRFVMTHDPNTLVLNVAGYGELSINMPHPVIQSLQPPGPGLMRSKSDHRLASQYRGEDRTYDRSPYDASDPMQGRVSPLGGRKFGERPRERTDVNSSSRYGGRNEREYGEEYDPDNRQSARSRIRARFRHGAGEADSDSETHGGRSVRFNETHAPPAKEREKVLDTEDVAKGPLSGITRLLDSPRVMKKLLDSSIKKTKKENEPAPPLPTQNQKNPIVRKMSSTPATPPVTQRQVSEDDEIARIKKQNKTAGSSSETVTREPVRPSSERVAALKQQSSSDQRTPERSPSRRPSTQEVTSSEADSDEEVAAIGSLRKTSTTASPPNTKPAPPRRVGAEVVGAKPDAESTGATPNRTRTSSDARRGSVSSTGSTTASPATSTTTQTTKPFQSRFLGGGNRPSTTSTTATPTKPTPPATKEEEEEDDDDEEETEEETETSSESEETESEEEAVAKKPAAAMEKTDIGPLLARAANARDTTTPSSSTSNARDAFISSRYNNSSDSKDSTSYKPYGSKDETSTTGSKYGSASSRNRLSDDDIPSRFGTSTTTASQSRARPSYETDSTSSRYGVSRDTRAGSIGTSLGSETPSTYTSRFLNKSKSTAMVSPEDEKDESSLYSSGRTRFAALKDRKARLARSKSSHTLMLDDEEFDDGPNSPYSPAAYMASKAAASSSSVSDFPSQLTRSRSSHTLKSRDNSPDRSTAGYSSNASAGGEKDGAALSSWARYLKSKYGNRGKDGAGSSSSGTATSATPTRRSSLHSRHGDDSDDESKNLYGSPNVPIQTTAQTGIGQVGTTPRSQYLQKRRLQFKIGSRGSEPGCFTWPRGIAVGPDNSIVVADSSNHRVQVFDSDGIFTKEFGSYGNAEGEFDCLAGVAVNRIGQFIIADRYNHRIQVMDPSGRFLRAFGSQGTADGKFNYPWGITTDALGFIYVCDKENHRVQVFQSDGTFVGKFGSMGNKAGQLEHPHYIAVSNTNRVIVSDSNNHRVQIFDVNGRVITSFGSEGSEEGQFKFPRGVAVDDQGFISVGDSGNNRIQIFTPDGQFLRAFGCWGSGDAEFKGLEGVAVMSNGNILVCDRENHRIQVF